MDRNMKNNFDLFMYTEYVYVTSKYIIYVIEHLFTQQMRNMRINNNAYILNNTNAEKKLCEKAPKST